MKLLVALIALVLVAAQPVPGRAQDATTSPTISSEDVARLSDEEVRRLLLERLVAEDGGAVEAPFNPAFTAYALQQELGQAQKRAGEIAASFPVLLRLPAETWSRMMRDRSAGSFGLFLAVFALSIAAATAADRWLARRLSRFMPEPPPLEHPPVGSRASAACAGLLIEAARLAGFVIAAAAVFFVLGSDEARDRTAFVFYLSAAAIVKGAGAVARVYLAPKHPGARIPAFEEIGRAHV